MSQTFQRSKLRINVFYKWAALGAPGIIYWEMLLGQITLNLAAWPLGMRVLYAGDSFEDASRAIQVVYSMAV